MRTERNESDIKRMGRDIYGSKVMWKLADDDKGKMVVIDVDSGDYEVDAIEAKALEKLLSRRPDACTWTEKFQGPRVFRMGWRATYGRLSFDEGFPSREEIRNALDEARRRAND